MRFLWLIAALSSGIALGWHLDRAERPAGDEAPPAAYLPPVWAARGAALGHETLAADYFWLKTLQYYADDVNKRTAFQDLDRLLDLVVGLDPDFEYAYRFGGFVLPFNSGHWTWHNLPAAEAFLLRGAHRYPDEWQLWLQLGFVRGVLGDDVKGAAEAYWRAAEAPGAPHWMLDLIPRLEAVTGSLERARAYVEQILLSTEDPDLQEAMAQRLLEIESEERLRRLDEAITRFTAARGSQPARLDELVTSGFLERIPEDPLGGEYSIEDGKARSSSFAQGRLKPYEEEDRR